MAASTSTDGSKTLKPSAIEIPTSRGSDMDIEGPPMSPLSWHNHTTTFKAPSRHQTAASLDVDDYFSGPRDMAKHSKWPFFLRMHGSVLPKMILPLIVVASWSTLITCLCEFVYELKVSSLLLTVLGFVVGMAISFRTSSAYERYMEGRKYWSQLALVSQNFSRTVWIHVLEREGDLGKEDLLAKVSALNLVVAFSRSVRHKLRFEPGIDYPDLKSRIDYLDTFAKHAEPEIPKERAPSKLKAMGGYLGVTFAESNPRKRIKRSKRPLGNLPLEILNHLSSYVEYVNANETLKNGLYHNQLITSIVAFNDVLVGVDRVLNTPLPIAYSIAISQITWVYVLMLPFQMWDDLRWVTIPGCIFAAYIILGIAAIGSEIENPFGDDVNDLPLQSFCEELEADINYMMSNPKPQVADFFRRDGNMPLDPLSNKSFSHWMKRDKKHIRDALMTKTQANMHIRNSFVAPREDEVVEEKGHGTLLQPQHGHKEQQQQEPQH